MFDSFPVNWYPSFQSPGRELQTNITKYISLNLEGISNLLIDYRMSDRDTLFSVSYKQYKDNKYWIILAMINNINHPDKIFLSDMEFEEYLDTLPGNPKQDIAHYLYTDNSATTLESIRTLIERNNDLSDLQLIQKYKLKAISRYDIMMIENERRRTIKVPHSSIIEELYRKVERQLQNY